MLNWESYTILVVLEPFFLTWTLADWFLVLHFNCTDSLNLIRLIPVTGSHRGVNLSQVTWFGLESQIWWLWTRLDNIIKDLQLNLDWSTADLWLCLDLSFFAKQIHNMNGQLNNDHRSSAKHCVYSTTPSWFPGFEPFDLKILEIIDTTWGLSIFYTLFIYKEPDIELKPSAEQ